MMTNIAADWEAYAKSTFSPIIQAHYFFTVWRNYRLLLHGLEIPQGTLLEIGSSTGLNSLRLVKKYNFTPTLVDTSKLALAFARQLYKINGLTPRLINQDVINLDLNKHFDFVHSHGLLEHFSPSSQKIAFQNHVKHVKTDGWLICWVPTPDILYRISRWYLENTGQWIFGFEKPLPLSRFIRLFQQEKLTIRNIRHVPGWIGIAAQNKNLTSNTTG